MGAVTQKLKGSTLVEVLVAMVIIMGCMGIALTIYSNISHDMNDELKISAEIRLNTMAGEARDTKNYSDETVNLENMRIEKTVSNYKNSKDIKILNLQAFTTSGKKITAYQELIAIQ